MDLLYTTAFSMLDFMIANFKSKRAHLRTVTETFFLGECYLKLASLNPLQAQSNPMLPISTSYLAAFGPNLNFNKFVKRKFIKGIIFCDVPFDRTKLCTSSVDMDLG